MIGKTVECFEGQKTLESSFKHRSGSGVIEQLQFKEKGSLLAQKDLTGTILSNALSVTNTPGYKSFGNISYTFASSRRAQVTVIHCSIVRNINRLLQISVHPNMDRQSVLNSTSFTALLCRKLCPDRGQLPRHCQINKSNMYQNTMLNIPLCMF